MQRKWIFIALVLGLQGCASQHGGSDTATYSGSWGNYKCAASSAAPGGYTAIGWATSEGMARDNAMDKCRANSEDPDTCQVRHCRDESTEG